MRNICTNRLNLTLPALSVNEGAARAMVSAFCAQLNPTIEELADIKCAVSEAVTNCIVHAYRARTSDALITLSGEYYSGGRVVITVKDRGCGIEDIDRAMQPLFTTDAESERSGMGFTVMESFCDRVRVRSRPGKGTTVRLEKRILLT